MEPTEHNRKAWDEIHRRRTEAMAGQLGIPDGIRELLPEVNGKHVLHLQCATGESTAELAKLGALVTALDISSEALEIARERAPDAAYVHADVQELPLELRRGRFDLVYTGGGVFSWLHDLDAWAQELRETQPLSAISKIPPRPLLLVHGTADDVVSLADARALADAAGESADLRVVAGAGHRLRHDPRAVAVLIGWMERQEVG